LKHNGDGLRCRLRQVGNPDVTRGAVDQHAQERTRAVLEHDVAARRSPDLDVGGVRGEYRRRRSSNAAAIAAALAGARICGSLQPPGAGTPIGSRSWDRSVRFNFGAAREARPRKYEKSRNSSNIASATSIELPRVGIAATPPRRPKPCRPDPSAAP
jgi:hypothetical protein